MSISKIPRQSRLTGDRLHVNKRTIPFELHADKISDRIVTIARSLSNLQCVCAPYDVASKLFRNSTKFQFRCRVKYLILSIFFSLVDSKSHKSVTLSSR